MDWFGSVLVRDRDPLDELGLLENNRQAPWHAEQYLVGDRITIDMTACGGPVRVCEITARRPNGDRIDLTVAPVELPREYPLA